MANSKPATTDKEYSTPVDVPDKHELIGILNQQLANVFDLHSQTKHAHWNVKGPNFYGLHKLFDDLHEMVEANIDTIAERLTALGGVAHGTARMASSATELDEFPVDLSASLDVVRHMSQVYAQCANGVRESIDKADDLGDQGTADMLTDVVRDLDKGIYFLDSHLQK